MPLVACTAPHWTVKIMTTRFVDPKQYTSHEHSASYGGEFVIQTKYCLLLKTTIITEHGDVSLIYCILRLFYPSLSALRCMIRSIEPRLSSPWPLVYNDSTPCFFKSYFLAEFSSKRPQFYKRILCSLLKSLFFLFRWITTTQRKWSNPYQRETLKDHYVFPQL